MRRSDEYMDVESNRQGSHDLCRRNLAFLRRLTHTFAQTWDHDLIVKALFAELPSVIDADIIGLGRRNPHRVWMWAKPQHSDRADGVRAHILDQLECAGGQTVRKTVPRERSNRGRLRHLSLVPPIDVHRHSQEPLPHCMHEVRLAIGSPGEGVLHLERVSGEPFSGQEQQLAQTVEALLTLALANADAHRLLRESDVRDPLTGLFNRAALDGILHRELHAGVRYGVSACLILLDLDHFRVVSDRLGLMAGDMALKSVAVLVEKNIRDVDSVSRYGGDVFAVVLPHTGLGQAEALAERIRGEVERQAFKVEDGHVRLTGSIGLAVCHNARGESVGGWIAAAESALQEAKARGRNCVVIHAAAPHTPAHAALTLVA